MTDPRISPSGGRSGADAVTVAQLLDALDQLREHGIALAGPGVNPDLAGQEIAEALKARVEELEAELEEAGEETAAAIEREDAARSETARQVQLRDRFEREAAEARRAEKGAHSGHSAAVEAGRQAQDRQRLRWLLAQLGTNAPGFDDMPLEELRETASQALGHTLKDAQALRLTARELRRAGQLLQRGLDGLTYLPGEDDPLDLGASVVALADRVASARRAALARQSELEDQLAMAETAPAPDEVLTRQLEHVSADRDRIERARADLVARLAEAEPELERWTIAGPALVRMMEPGLSLDHLEGEALRAAVIAAVRRQLDRVEAIGGRLGREGQISAEQRRRAEAAEAELAALRGAVIRAVERQADGDRAGTFHQLTTAALIEELDG